MNRFLGPHAAAAGAGVTADYFRHCRRCGHLDSIGIRDGKKIIYSIGEVIRITLALHLTAYGFTLRRAFNAGEDHAAKLEALGMRGALHAGADLILEFHTDDSMITLLAVNATALAEQVLARLAKFKIQNPA
jgi:hypothetical protein